MTAGTRPASTPSALTTPFPGLDAPQSALKGENQCRVCSRLDNMSSVPASVFAATEDPLNYRNIERPYIAPKPSNTTTLLEYIKSRSDLSRLSEALDKVGGFSEAFDTDPTWKFTFFAPNNDAFEKNVGRYFNTFESTPYGHRTE
ncbi:hypothetical protein ACP6JB_008851 [Aspergillus fumigatus]